MENRKKLHDYGLVLILLGVLNLFMFVSTFIAGIVDGTVAAAFADVDADILVAVKVLVGIIGGLTGLIVVADVFIGIKALKVSQNPNADKGHIIAATVFFVMCVISAVSAISALFSGGAPIVDTILNLANAALSAVIYVFFIKAAQDVRRDVLNGVK
jgi:hypothetical protein